MVSFDVDEILTRRMADLARLELSDAEVKTFTPQLGGILQYVELLQGLDLSGVEPMVCPLDLSTALREDVVQPSPVDEKGRPKVLACAPDVLDDGFKVPPIL